jgi:hypothetical protein
MFTVVNGEAVTLKGEPVIAVYCGEVAAPVGATGVAVVSMAFLPMPHAPVDALSVKLNGELVEIAAMVPVPVEVGPTAVRVVLQVPREGDRVRLNGEVVDLAVIVPWMLYWPSARVRPLICMPPRPQDAPGLVTVMLVRVLAGPL